MGEFNRILTDAEAEEQARDDYCRLSGKVVWAIGLYVREGDDIGFKGLVEPALFRVSGRTSDADVVRWMDDRVIEPVYGVDLLQAHPDLGNACIPLCIDGPSVAVDGDAFEPWTTVAVADPALQALHAKTAAIRYDPDGKAPVPGR